jgi:hypothetical protein
MKKYQNWLIIIVVQLFFIAPIFAQGQIQQVSKDSLLVKFEREISSGFTDLVLDGEFLSAKSYDWLETYAPNLQKHRFDSEQWLEINNEFKVGVYLPRETPAIMRIFNTDGELILEEKHNLKLGVHRFPVLAKDWEIGGYIIHIETNVGDVIKKVIKI